MKYLFLTVLFLSLPIAAHADEHSNTKHHESATKPQAAVHHKQTQNLQEQVTREHIAALVAHSRHFLNHAQREANELGASSAPEVLGTGEVLDSIPTDYQVVTVNGINYMFTGGVYYQRQLDGFEVVPPPMLDQG